MDLVDRCPKASWLQSKQLAGSSFSLEPHEHHFRPSCLCLGSSCLDFYAHASPSLCSAFSLPYNPYSLPLYLLLSPSPPPLLLSSLPTLRSPRMGLPPPSFSSGISPSLALTPAPLSLYSSRPFLASPASLLPRLASASPSLPIFSSVSSLSLCSPPLSPPPSVSPHSLPAYQDFFPPWGSLCFSFSPLPASSLTSDLAGTHLFQPGNPPPQLLTSPLYLLPLLLSPPSPLLSSPCPFKSSWPSLPRDAGMEQTLICAGMESEF